jgi:parallel beta-helix repeat protein
MKRIKKSMRKIQKSRYINKEETMKTIIGLLILAAIFWCSPAGLEAADRTLDCATGTINSFLPRLRPGDRLIVSGTCNENVVISTEFSRITLDGQGTATINGPDPAANTVLVRGRNITIRGFTITGGSRGILVSRGAEATIDGNTIQNTGSDGIQVSDVSAARIINNTIQNNPDTGISVFESSSAFVGFLVGTDITASPNTIQNNATRGIIVSRTATARIVGNTISGNGDDGVGVFRNSQADIANNIISNNGSDGIALSNNSVVNLGSDTGTRIFDLPNDGSGNVGFGINCGTGGVADGRQGTITGNSGATNFGTSCINSLVP